MNLCIHFCTLLFYHFCSFGKKKKNRRMEEAPRRVFVAGGTGRVGRSVVHLLASRFGCRVTVLTRAPTARAAAALMKEGRSAAAEEAAPAGTPPSPLVALVEGDLRAPDAETALRAAIEACRESVVVSCAGGSPPAVAAAGARRR